MTNKLEALFQEHWRRFFLSPQADSVAVRRISGALYWNDQLLWSLGVIPWGAWRLPFQASILRFLHETLPHDAARLYTSIHTALATAHGDFLSSLSEMDKQKLVQRVEQFCEGETLAHLVRQIQSITPKQPFFRNAALESMLRCISVKYREIHTGYDCFFCDCSICAELYQAESDHLLLIFSHPHTSPEFL